MPRKRYNKRPFSQKQVDQIPKKPGVYTLLNRAGNPIYVGSSKKGERRLEEHLRQQDIPGVAHFRFQQTPSAREAKPLEKRLIKRHKPKYNEPLKD